ncbi:MAG: S8 family serine peptidase, partial [Eubacteriales bacterium]|nr:S8 family serine peptidase [Eubacteriales bacterium]
DAVPGEDSVSGGKTVFTRRTGTSVSAAIAAGAAACILSWGYTEHNDETLTGTSVKAMLIRGAGRIPAFSWPDRQWGYGTLNLYQSFLSLRE